MGIMGFAVCVAALGARAASTAAVGFAEELMGFIQKRAKLASAQLASARAPFTNFYGTRLNAEGREPVRNACVTSTAPTGTISLLAGCSSGIEPFFALSYRREVIGSTKSVDIHPQAARMLRSEAPDPEPLLKHVRATGRLDTPSAPEKLRQLFATAHEIAPALQIRIQAAFQRPIYTSVRKTINLTNR